jgi:hypothetical protein
MSDRRREAMRPLEEAGQGESEGAGAPAGARPDAPEPGTGAGALWPGYRGTGLNPWKSSS